MLIKKAGIDCDLGSFLKQEIGSVIDDIDVNPADLIHPKSEVFTEQFLKDSRGQLVTNEAVHNSMHRFIRISRKNGYNKFLISGGFSLGKTENMCMGFVLHEIAKNPNILVKIVHLSDDEASKRCRALRDYIGNDPDVKRIAPHLQPTAIWGSQRFTVKRDTMSLNSTVEAYGVLSTSIGGRANLIVFDDPQDLRAAVLEPTTRKKIEDTFKNVWLTRLIPGDSEALVLMNRWHSSLISGQVLTLDGIKDISELTVNDTVFTHKGLQPVLDTSVGPYRGKTFKIVTWYYTALNATYTEDHEILTKNGWEYAINLTTDDYLIVPIWSYGKNWLNKAKSSFPDKYEYKKKKPNIIPKVDISKLELEEYFLDGLTYKDIADLHDVSVGTIYNLARFFGINNRRINDLSLEILEDRHFWKILGYWIAEGSLTYGTLRENRSVIRFTFGSHETDYINEVKDFFNKYNIHVGEDYTIRNSCTLKLSSSQLASWLKFNFSEGSGNFTLPDWFFGLPEDLFFEFLAGYFNGDGNCRSNGDFVITSISKSLLLGIQLNLLRFGIISSVNNNSTGGIKLANFGFGSTYINSKDSYILKINGNQNNDSKFAYIKDNKLYVKIKTIEEGYYDGDVYDITTPSNTFCACGYIVHNSDLIGVLMQNPTWSWMSLAVSETLDYIIYKDSFSNEYKLPLWSKMTKKDYEIKIHDMGQRDFDRGYRLIAYSDADKTFPSFKECCRFGIGPEAIIENESNWMFVGGIDFASLKRPGTVLSVVAAHRRSGLKVPVYIKMLRGSNDLPEEMVKVWRQFGVDHFVAENNGLQDTIIELLESALGTEKYKRFGIRIEPFLTSRNKADPIQGLPSINKEFEKGEWLFPLRAEPVMGDCDINDPWVKMYFEFSNHPFYETSDIVMSLWFCREGIKTFYRQDSGPNVY